MKHLVKLFLEEDYATSIGNDPKYFKQDIRNWLSKYLVINDYSTYIFKSNLKLIEEFIEQSSTDNLINSFDVLLKEFNRIKNLINVLR